MRRASLWIVLALLAMIPAGVRCAESGGDPSSVAVMNNTVHYLHVIVDDTTFPYLAPGEATRRVPLDIYQTVRITAYYSPGEPVSGSYSFEYTAGGSTSGGLSCDENYSLQCEPVTEAGEDDLVSIDDADFGGGDR